MTKPYQVFLCDMVHNYLGAGTYTTPLSIGFLAGYAKKILGNEVDIRLFKYPDKLLSALKDSVPHLIGFSNYAWNDNLNNKLSQHAKELFPGVTVVCGGPSLNYSIEGIRNFFSSHSAIDCYIPFEGEFPFVNFLKTCLSGRKVMSELPENAGICYYDHENDVPVISRKISRTAPLDEIPSPYLEGFLDEFFDNHLIPVIETNRGCPYRCSYCCQAMMAGRKVEYFNIERVKEELNYIAERAKNTSVLLIADNNFGIHERDFLIAEHIRMLGEKKGYPRHVNANWAKQQPRIFEIASILDHTKLTISVQSLDADVLAKANRSGIDTKLFQDLIARINHAGGTSGTEVILALEGETKASHIQTLSTLFDWNVSYILCYNAMMLKGSEMACRMEEGDFACETTFRIFDGCAGEYSGIMAIECDEIVSSTDTMSAEDRLFFRPVHFLIQFLWNYRFYYDLLKYLQYLGINPLDFVLRIIDTASNGSGAVADIFNDFKKEARSECFDSAEECCQFYSAAENFKLLEDGFFGKLNGKYIFRVLLEAREDFNKHLLETAMTFPGTQDRKDIVIDMIHYLDAMAIDFRADWAEIVKERRVRSRYDIIKWRDHDYQGGLAQSCSTDAHIFRLSLPVVQQESLKILLEQYDHKNRNLMLRKMSEFMHSDDFYYNVENETSLA